MIAFVAYASEQEMCIYQTLKKLKSRQSNINKTEMIREMLIKLSACYTQFIQLYDANIDLKKHIITPCINYMVVLNNLFDNKILSSTTRTRRILSHAIKTYTRTTFFFF